MNLTYEVVGNGYKILRDGVPWFVQDIYIPYPGATVEESAKNHINVILEEADTAGKKEILLESLQQKIDAITKTPDNIYKETDQSTVTLEELKKLKEAQLSYLCTQSINSYFLYTPLSGETAYKFSYDQEAQGNFTDTLLAVSGGAITEIPWTAHIPDTMEVVRVTLTAQDFQQLVAVILQHKNGNISKFRDVLMQQVTEATTKEQVESVVW